MPNISYTEYFGQPASPTRTGKTRFVLSVYLEQLLAGKRKDIIADKSIPVPENDRNLGETTEKSDYIEEFASDFDFNVPGTHEYLFSEAKNVVEKMSKKLPACRFNSCVFIAKGDKTTVKWCVRIHCD